MMSQPETTPGRPVPARIQSRGLALLFAGVLSTALAGSARAQMTVPPEIDLISQTRDISLALNADNSSTNPGGSVGDNQTRNADQSGPFKATLDNTVVGDGGALAYGLVSQKSNISTFKIEGTSHMAAQCGDGPNNAQAGAGVGSEMNISFTVPIDATFDLSGTLNAVSSQFSFPAQILVVLTGTHPDGSPLYISEQTNSQYQTAPVNFFHTDMIKANTTVTLQVQALLQAGSLNVSSCIQSGDFTVEFNLGDADGDGLLDAWETDGIDVNHDGQPDIDLPGMGADPMKKDLFVELDALSGTWQSGYMASINDVIQAFAAAPAALIDNPDNSAGINLHVDVDETNISFTEPGQDPGTLSGLGGLDMIKADHFGSPSDRQLSYWSDLKDARSRVYRYCVWADSLAGSSSTAPTGVGETPGNDFIVAAKRARTVFSRNYVEDGLAGTFMHELGHNLGLRHGGEDTLAFKPNYLSVMNYMYQGPFTGTERAFTLDYSESTMGPLYELKLDETLALNGPHTKYIMYNAAPDGHSAWRFIAVADTDSVDWNQDGAFVDSVRQNISAILPSDPPDQFMKGSTDWDHLWYNLSGNVTFDDGLARGPGSVPAELPGDDFLAIDATPYVNLSTTGVADQTLNRPRRLHSWPNPFSPRMTIRFTLEHPQTVNLAVFNVQGQRVRVLMNDQLLAAGPHDVAWNGTDAAGRRAPEGVYFVRMRAGDRTEQVKVIRVD